MTQNENPYLPCDQNSMQPGALQAGQAGGLTHIKCGFEQEAAYAPFQAKRGDLKFSPDMC